MVRAAWHLEAIVHTALSELLGDPNGAVALNLVDPDTSLGAAVEQLRVAVADVEPVLGETQHATVLEAVGLALDAPSVEQAKSELLSVYEHLTAVTGIALDLPDDDGLPAQTYIEAPTPYCDDPRRRSVFLAGGIIGCPNWQAEARERLHHRMPEAVVLNPRRARSNGSAPDGEADEFGWEDWHLDCADVILFWFPNVDTDQSIAMFELGAAFQRHASIVVGADPDWHGYSNLVALTWGRSSDTMVHDDLDDAVGDTEHLLRNRWKQTTEACNALASARRRAFVAMANETRALYGPSRVDPDGLTVEQITDRLTTQLQFVVGREEVADHVHKVLLADGARSVLKREGLQNAHRHFYLYDDERDRNTLVTPVVEFSGHDHVGEAAALALRQAGYVLKFDRPVRRWIVESGPQ